jgi:uncharacterized membrane protein YphA (DoxX/SURF4 family)
MTPLALFLICLGLIAVLLAVSIWLTPSRESGAEPIGRGTRLFLVMLRLAIGWHFLTEGVDKLNNPAWSSENYLRASTGPLADHFRRVADQDLIAKLTLGPKGEFPEALDREWHRYLDQFIAEFEFVQDKLPTEAQIRKRYEKINTDLEKELANAKDAKKKEELEKKIKQNKKELNRDVEAAQDFRKRVEIWFDQAKAETLQWFTTKQRFEKFSPYMSRPGEMTVAERLQYYHDLVGQMNKVVAEEVPLFGGAAERKVREARDEADFIIRGLKTDLVAQTENMKKKLKTILPAEQQKSSMPETPKPPATEWSLLQWSDHVVPWALTIVGGMLLIGFLTRPACIVGALWMLLLYLTMIPLPGWPEPPRTEGHYLFINKNFIEMLALLVLATVRSGRWFGLDSLFAMLLAPRYKSAISRRPVLRRAPEASSGAAPVSAR